MLTNYVFGEKLFLGVHSPIYLWELPIVVWTSEIGRTW